MEKSPLTPSNHTYAMTDCMTEGQIDKILEIFLVQLNEHRREFNSYSIKAVLEQTDLGSDLLAVLNQRVEAVVSLVMRRARINPRLTPDQVIDATGRKKYLNLEVAETMPRGYGRSEQVYFFKSGRPLTDEELEEEYRGRHLRPADPYLLTQVNTDELSFADDYPNGTHWRDPSTGRWCFAIFCREGECNRVLSIDVSEEGWDDYWWFAGVREDLVVAD